MSITLETQTAYAMDTETVYLPEVKMFNEVIMELEFSQNIIVKGDNPQITRMVKCFIIDKKATQKRMNAIIKEYEDLEDEFIRLFGEEEIAEANAPSTPIAYPRKTVMRSNNFITDKLCYIDELKQYTPNTSIIFYHRITMTELVRVLKDMRIECEETNTVVINNKKYQINTIKYTLFLGKAVNKKTGVRCSYTDKRKLSIIRTQPPMLRQLNDQHKNKDFKIIIYPIIKNEYKYHTPTSLPPIILTLDKAVKEQSFNLHKPIEYDETYNKYAYRGNEGVDFTRTHRVWVHYKIILQIQDYTEVLIETAIFPGENCYKIYEQLLPMLINYIKVPTPYRLYNRTRHQNQLLTLLVRMKKWDIKGNPLLTGCKAIRYYDNDDLKTVDWDFTNYTTKTNLDNFMISCGYIQNKLHTKSIPITKKAIETETKIIKKTSYKDICLWIYKEY